MAIERKNYEISEEDLAILLNASKSVPMIMLQCGNPRSPQENANAGWEALGKKMEFDPYTVEPTGKGARFFTAVPVISKEPMSDKSPEMKAFIEGMFPGTKAAIAEKKCPLCKKPISEFRDALSRREYEISGMCQAYQDDIFAAGDDDDESEGVEL